ncbi:MAG: O-methyltransferase [Thermomicrobiales bacterium]
MTPQAKAVLDRLYDEDAEQRTAGLDQAQPTRNVDRDTGRFLSMLTLSGGYQNVLEIGSSNGVSTIWFAAAVAQTGGHVTGTEILPQRAAEANANLAAAGLHGVATVLAGAASEHVTSLPGPFDLVFIDAEKEDYVDHLHGALPLLRQGGLVLADNVISHDLSEFQEKLRSLPGIQTVTLPLGRGLEFAVRSAAAS